MKGTGVEERGYLQGTGIRRDECYLEVQRGNIDVTGALIDRCG